MIRKVIIWLELTAVWYTERMRGYSAQHRASRNGTHTSSRRALAFIGSHSTALTQGYTPLFTSVKRLPVKVYHNCSPWWCFRVFEISMVGLHFIWPNLGFAGSCEYLLNKSAQKPWNFLLFKNLSGAWTHKSDRGYEAIMITRNRCFQKPVDINKSRRKKLSHF